MDEPTVTIPGVGLDSEPLCCPLSIGPYFHEFPGEINRKKSLEIVIFGKEV